MKIPKLLTKQMSGASMWLGKLMFLGTQISIYLTAMTFILSATSAYSVSIAPFLQENGIDLPFIAYLSIIAVGLIILLIFTYKVVLPGFFSLSNKQFYEHENPMVADIKGLKEQLDRIEKRLENK